VLPPSAAAGFQNKPPAAVNWLIWCRDNLMRQVWSGQFTAAFLSINNVFLCKVLITLCLHVDISQGYGAARMLDCAASGLPDGPIAAYFRRAFWDLRN
jgi:hypothetical protein